MESLINTSTTENEMQELYEISVIIPTYNRSNVLKMCLENLNDQTFDLDKFEVIVIDDGSTDDTEKVVTNFPNKYRLVYIKQNNSGPGAARNKGIQIAKGKLVLIINDDALLDKENLKVHFETHHKLAGSKLAVIGKFDYAKEFLNQPFVWLAQNSNLVFSYNVLQEHQIYNYRFFWTCNISIPTEAIRQAGYFDENFAEPMMEDTELGYRLQQIGYGVYYEPKAIATHYHWIDLQGFIKRQEMSGRNVIKFIAKYPPMLEIERNVFGLTQEDITAPESIQAKIDQLENPKNLLIRDINEFQKFKILEDNGKELIFENNQIFDRNELLKTLSYAGFIIHRYYYLKGVLDELKRINFQLNYTPKQMEDISKAVKIIEKPMPLETNNKFKILMTTYGWTQQGGGTELPKSIALHLVKKGIEVVVVAAEQNHHSIPTPYYVDTINENGVKVYKIFNRPTTFLDATNPRREINDEKIVEIIDKIIDNEKPNIVHFHNFLGLSFAIADLPKSRNIPSLFTAHNFHLIDPELYMFDFHDKLQKWTNTDLFENSYLTKSNPNLQIDYKIRQEMARQLLREKIDVFIAISRRFAQIYDEFAGIYAKTVVLNQVSEICDSLKPWPKEYTGKLRVGFLGSILIHKGVHLIYQAAELLKDYDIEFYIYGYGNEQYINILKDKFPNNRVHLMGSYASTDLQEISKQIDCVVIPSVWEEGGPLVAAEALSLGLPIIGADIGGIPDFVVDGLNGKLFKYNDPRDLVEKLKFLYYNPQELAQLQLNSYIPYTFNEYIDKLIQLYEYLIESKDLTKIKNFQLIFSSLLTSRSNSTQKSTTQENFDANDLIELLSLGSSSLPTTGSVNTNIAENPFSPIMLNLASQGEIIDGFINIDQNPQKDKEIKGDIRKLNYKDNSIEIIIAKNILQVFSHREFSQILKEWNRVLKPGGTLLLSVPDLKSILTAYVQGKLDFEETQKAIFGNQVNEFDYYYNAFDENSIQIALTHTGFIIIELKNLKINSEKFDDIFVRCIKNFVNDQNN